VIELVPAVLEGHGVRLEPMETHHAEGLREAAADGELWRLFFTFVPKPEETPEYIQEALDGHASGHMLPWVVVDSVSGQIIGTSRYHDVMAAVDRVEIGYTWYRPAWHRTHVNTACKLHLLTYAFDRLGCGVVGLRTDVCNFRSQRAIEGIGAKKDGVLRHHALRRDGTVRDDVMYSILSTEWHGVRRHLETRLWQNR
jgi:RimJ/RimL family protein N-acetyltransferase